MSTELRNYKASFILDTREHEAPIETLIDHLKEVIGSINGEVVKVEDLGDKDFARVTNRKMPSGRYVQFELKGPSTLTQTLNEKLRLDRKVNRVMVELV